MGQEGIVKTFAPHRGEPPAKKKKTGELARQEDTIKARCEKKGYGVSGVYHQFARTTPGCPNHDAVACRHEIAARVSALLVQRQVENAVAATT